MAGRVGKIAMNYYETDQRASRRCRRAGTGRRRAGHAPDARLHDRGNPGRSAARPPRRPKGQLFFDTGNALSKIDVEAGPAGPPTTSATPTSSSPTAGSRPATASARRRRPETYASAVENAQAAGRVGRDGVRPRGAGHPGRAVGVRRRRVRLATKLTPPRHDADDHPFDDPGQAIRDNAVRKFETAKATSTRPPTTCADQVRGGCYDAPEEPAGSSPDCVRGRRARGGRRGAVGPVTMSPFSAVNMIRDYLQAGDRRPHARGADGEVPALAGDRARHVSRALQGSDPVEFGKELGKGLLDWDTWADDPARALGHLVPDAIAAVGPPAPGPSPPAGALGAADGVGALSGLCRTSTTWPTWVGSTISVT